MRRLFIGAGIAIATGLGSAASAHDFFLLPERFVASGQRGVSVQATVGSSFPTPEVVVTPDRIERVTAVGAGNPQVHVMGPGPKALNLHIASARHGLLAVGVATKARDVEYGEDRIPLILGEYRVLPQAAAAVEALPRPRNWKVSSRRFAKTFVCLRTCGNRLAAERSFGAQLEFVGRRSSNNHFRLLAAGKPLPNYPVDLVGADGKRRHLTTDARGEVHIPATARGMMMLFAARLQPPVGQSRFMLDLTSLTIGRD